MREVTDRQEKLDVLLKRYAYASECAVLISECKRYIFHFTGAPDPFLSTAIREEEKAADLKERAKDRIFRLFNGEDVKVQVLEERKR